MIEHAPKILASEEKATTTRVTASDPQVIEKKERYPLDSNVPATALGHLRRKEEEDNCKKYERITISIAPFLTKKRVRALKLSCKAGVIQITRFTLR